MAKQEDISSPIFVFISKETTKKELSFLKRQLKKVGMFPIIVPPSILIPNNPYC